MLPVVADEIWGGDDQRANVEPPCSNRVKGDGRTRKKEKENRTAKFLSHLKTP